MGKHFFFQQQASVFISCTGLLLIIPINKMKMRAAKLPDSINLSKKNSYWIMHHKELLRGPYRPLFKDAGDFVPCQIYQHESELS